MQTFRSDTHHASANAVRYVLADLPARQHLWRKRLRVIDNDDAAARHARLKEGHLFGDHLRLMRAVQEHIGVFGVARLLEVELEIEDGELVYELEVLTTGGQVRELEFDAATGVLVKDEEED